MGWGAEVTAKWLRAFVAPTKDLSLFPATMWSGSQLPPQVTNSFSKDLIFWPSKVNTPYPKHAQAHTPINQSYPPPKKREKRKKRMGWTHKFNITLKNTKTLSVCACIWENVKQSSKVIYTAVTPEYTRKTSSGPASAMWEPISNNQNKTTHCGKFLELLCLHRKSQKVSVWLN